MSENCGTEMGDHDRRPARPKGAAALRVDVELLAMTPLPSVADGWSTIYADPPWRFTNRTGKVAPEHRRLDRYDTMTYGDFVLFRWRTWRRETRICTSGSPTRCFPIASP